MLELARRPMPALDDDWVVELWVPDDLPSPDDVYPPGMAGEDFGHVPPRSRSDAVQEAWAAHLEGQDPRKARDRFAQQERRYERRQVPGSQLLPEARAKDPNHMRGYIDLAALGSECHRFPDDLEDA